MYLIKITNNNFTEVQREKIQCPNTQSLLALQEKDTHHGLAGVVGVKQVGVLWGKAKIRGRPSFLVQLRVTHTILQRRLGHPQICKQTTHITSHVTRTLPDHD